VNSSGAVLIGAGPSRDRAVLNRQLYFFPVRLSTIVIVSAIGVVSV
jgi:hypothetical protein